jgi:tetratricopeptide (TPR) repeat protein
MTLVNTLDLYNETGRLMDLHSERKHEEAKLVGDTLLAFFASSNTSPLSSISSFVMGMRHHVKSEFKEAITYFNEGIYSSTDEKDIAAINHLGLAFSSRSMGNLDEAVSQLFIAAEKLNPNGPLKKFLMYIYVQLGEIHVAINEHEAALDFFDKVLNAKDNEWKNLALLYNAIGVCYHKMNQFDKSKEFFLKALESKDIAPTLLSKAQNDLGMLYLDLNELSESEKLFKESIRIREEYNMEDAASTSMCHLAETYIKQDRILEAITLLNTCMEISKKYHTKLKELKILNLIIKAHCANKEYQIASEYYDQYNQLQSEIKIEQEKNILKLKNEQIESQRKIISEKHQQLAATLDEIKQLKINRKAMIFSWTTVIVLVLISEVFIDPLIENYAYNTIISLLIKVGIALLIKPFDGLYESILWNRTMKKIN